MLIFINLNIVMRSDTFVLKIEGNTINRFKYKPSIYLQPKPNPSLLYYQIHTANPSHCVKEVTCYHGT